MEISCDRAGREGNLLNERKQRRHFRALVLIRKYLNGGGTIG